MGQIQVTLSANAGVCIALGGKKIWVDALYEGEDCGFSAMTQAFAEQVLASDAFANPDCICYTHCHPDHYSRVLTEKAMERWQDAKLFLPKQDFAEQFLLAGDRPFYTDGDMILQFFALPHEGEQYQQVSHYGLLIKSSQGNILLPGDCALAAPALEEAIMNEEIHLAILDFPWITLGKGRAFLQDVIKPKHILAYHLPFAQEDKNRYGESAEKAAERLRKQYDVRLLQKSLQTEYINI